MSIQDPDINDPLKISREGLTLVKNWERAKEDFRQAQLTLDNRRNAYKAAEAALAKWMLPHDIQPNEKIAVWVGNNLIQIRAAGSAPNDDHTISIRQRTK